MYLRDDLLKGVFPQSRIDGGVDHGDKVPQRLGWKEAAEIYRHGDAHRIQTEMKFLRLLLEQRIEQYRVQIFGDACAVLFGNCHDL